MAYIMFDDNQVVITGKIVMDFTFSHKICGECFYKTELQVKRLSDSVDTIPVLISEQIADITKSRVGEFAEIYGEFHSHNLREENHTRLELYVFARELLCSPTCFSNNQCSSAKLTVVKLTFTFSIYTEILSSILL